MRKDLRMATWNIRTMLQAGKLEEIADELKKNNMQITALQEIRWPNSGYITKKDYTFMYSGLKDMKGQRGTGFLVRGEARKCIMGFEPINERMCKLRIKGKFCNITIVSVYAPTEDKELEEKEKFYSEIMNVYDKIPK